MVVKGVGGGGVGGVGGGWCRGWLVAGLAGGGVGYVCMYVFICFKYKLYNFSLNLKIVQYSTIA